MQPNTILRCPDEPNILYTVQSDGLTAIGEDEHGSRSEPINISELLDCDVVQPG